ncbi:MAG: hypothetical protein WC974_08930 [Thermoplasmata archaeon]
MASNLKYNVYPLAPEASTNDLIRPGSLFLERHKITWTPNATTAVTVDLTSVFGKGKCDASDLIGVICLTSRGTAVLLGASVAQHSSTAGAITVSLNASTTYSTATTMDILVVGLAQSETSITLG